MMSEQDMTILIKEGVIKYPECAIIADKFISIKVGVNRFVNIDSGGRMRLFQFGNPYELNTVYE